MGRFRIRIGLRVIGVRDPNQKIKTQIEKKFEEVVVRFFVEVERHGALRCAPLKRIGIFKIGKTNTSLIFTDWCWCHDNNNGGQ